MVPSSVGLTMSTDEFAGLVSLVSISVECEGEPRWGSGCLGGLRQHVEVSGSLRGPVARQVIRRPHP